MALSMVAVAGLAYDAGLRNPAKIAQAVAIATAESGRNPTRLGDLGLQDSTWGPSVGLWQIRSLKAEEGKGTTRDADKLRDPAHNARAMVEISRSGETWRPWTVTHVTNPAGYLRYKAALPQATQATAIALAGKGVQAAGEEAREAASGVLEPVEQLAATVSDIAQTPARVANWLTEPGTWVRLVFFVAGGALLLLGVAQVAKGPMTRAVTNVIPVGKVAGKVLKKAKVA